MLLARSWLRHDIRLDPHGAHETYALAIAGHTTGMAPLLGYWGETGIVAANALVACRFADYLSHARRRAARMTREVLPALDALAARGIPTIVMKGFHTGQVYFPEPGARRMADVDLLVSPDRIAMPKRRCASGISPRSAGAAAVQGTGFLPAPTAAFTPSSCPTNEIRG